MFASTNQQFPFQKPWKQAFEIYFSRLGIFLGMFLVSAAIGLSWLGVSSWEHLSHEGRVRSAYFVIAVVVFLIVVNGAVLLVMHLRLKTQKSWEELRRVQAIANRQLVEHHRDPLPESITEAKKKKKTDRLFTFSSVEDEREVASARYAIVCGLINAMEKNATPEQCGIAARDMILARPSETTTPTV